MKLHITGTPDGPYVLLLSGGKTSPEELCAGLPGLAGKYRLLAASAGAPDALYEALRAAGCVRLWGAYGLEEGASALLAFLAEGRMEVRTAVTEGPFRLPAASLRDYRGSLVCWKGGKDKKAKQAWEALKKDMPRLRSLTLGKLKAGETYLGRRPDLMEKRLIATFGEAMTLTMSDLLLCPLDRAWRRVSVKGVGTLLRLLPELEPLTLDSERHRMLTRGQGGPFLFWDHLLTLESAGDGACLLTDQVMFAPAKNPGLTASLVRMYLSSEQKRRAALVTGE